MDTFGCLAIVCFYSQGWKNIKTWNRLLLWKLVSSYARKSFSFLRPIITWNYVDPAVRTANRGNLIENKVEYNQYTFWFRELHGKANTKWKYLFSFRPITVNFALIDSWLSDACICKIIKLLTEMPESVVCFVKRLFEKWKENKT